MLTLTLTLALALALTPNPSPSSNPNPSQVHAAMEQRNASAMAEVRASLESSQQAEQALLQRLHLQHNQQEALEDKGVSVQQTNSLTFDEIRALLVGNGAAIARESDERRAGEAEARRDVDAEASAREAALEQAALAPTLALTLAPTLAPTLALAMLLTLAMSLTLALTRALTLEP